MKVRVVERVVTEVRERRIETPHPRIDCVCAVLADDKAILEAIVILTALVRDTSRGEYDPGQSRFERIRHHVAALQKALDQRANANASPSS